MTLIEFETYAWTACAGIGIIASSLLWLDTYLDCKERERQQKNGMMTSISRYQRRAETVRWIQQAGFLSSGIAALLPGDATQLVVISLFVSSLGLMVNTFVARQFRKQMGYPPVGLRDAGKMIVRAAKRAVGV